MNNSIKNILLVLVSMVLTLSALEVALRFIDPDLFHDIALRRAFFLRYDSQMGWANKKNASGMHHPNPSEPAVYVATNGKELRGEEFPYDKPQGVTRVLIVGDSITFGYGVEEKDSYPYLLQQKLPKGYQVINGGVVGHGTDQEYLFFKSELSKYDPDIVVVAISGGDVFDNSCSIRYGTPKPFFRFVNGRLYLNNTPTPDAVPLEDVYFKKRPLQRMLFRHLALYRFVLFRTSLVDKVYEASQEEMSILEAVKVTSGLVGAFMDDCKARGCKIFFMAIPQSNWLESDFRSGHSGAIQALDCAGAEYIDLWEPFSKHIKEGIFQQYDYTHTNRKGNEIIAEKLFEALTGPQDTVTER